MISQDTQKRMNCYYDEDEDEDEDDDDDGGEFDMQLL